MPDAVRFVPPITTFRENLRDLSRDRTRFGSWLLATIEATGDVAANRYHHETRLISCLKVMLANPEKVALVVERRTTVQKDPG